MVAKRRIVRKKRATEQPQAEPPAPDYFAKWAGALDQRFDTVEVKLDKIDHRLGEHAQEDREVAEQMRSAHSALDKQLSAHAAELGMWRWVILPAVGALVLAMMQFCMGQIQPTAQSQTTSPTNAIRRP